MTDDRWQITDDKLQMTNYSMYAHHAGTGITSSWKVWYAETHRRRTQVVAAYNEVARSILPAAKKTQDVIREDASKVNFWDATIPTVFFGSFAMHISGIIMAQNMDLIDLKANTANLNTSELSLNLPPIVLAKEAKCVAEPVMKSWTPLNGTSSSS